MCLKLVGHTLLSLSGSDIRGQWGHTGGSWKAGAIELVIQSRATMEKASLELLYSN